jgi:hypothetical protein
MSWNIVIWSKNAGAYLTLAAFYGASAVWCKQRENRACWLFSCGLRIMRYRGQCIRGSCEVHVDPSKGTTVYRRVPLEAQPSFSTIS